MRQWSGRHAENLAPSRHAQRPYCYPKNVKFEPGPEPSPILSLMSMILICYVLCMILVGWLRSSAFRPNRVPLVPRPVSSAAAEVVLDSGFCEACNFVRVALVRWPVCSFLWVPLSYPTRVFFCETISILAWHWSPDQCLRSRVASRPRATLCLGATGPLTSVFRRRGGQPRPVRKIASAPPPPSVLIVGVGRQDSELHRPSSALRPVAPPTTRLHPPNSVMASAPYSDWTYV